VNPIEVVKHPARLNPPNGAFLPLAAGLCLLVSMVHHGRAAEAAKPVRVFILAGQSNMEGKAKLSLLNYQAEQPATRTLFAKYRADGKWVERDDVWIKFLERSGRLTVGFGSPECIGPELAFGWVMGAWAAITRIIILAAPGSFAL